MREHVKREVAIEIISMMIAFAVEDNNQEEINRLNKEKDMIYLGDETIIEKSYNEYSKIIYLIKNLKKMIWIMKNKK